MASFNYDPYQTLFEQFGLSNDAISQLRQAWREKHRYYHTEKHLQFLVDQIESWYQIGKVNENARAILLMAAFFHDIIYDPTAKDNEEQSAQLFEEWANHPEKDAIKTIILDTKHHHPANDLSALFCETDMAVVTGSSLQELLEWERGIFKEYQFVDYSLYKTGRLDFLNQCLQKYPQNQTNLAFLISFVQNFRPRIGVYPGSFNPFHNGHLNILEKAERVFDKIIIARGINPEKGSTDQDNLWPQVLKYRQHEPFKGLLTDYISSKETHADVTLIRGLRNGDDLDYEVNQLRFMEEMKPELKVVFIRCDKQFEHISSSAIRNLEKINQGLGMKYIPE